ncbi:MAG: CpsD/CapB family tyrosine-protein kinase, partial [Clostridia bacterium]|nr:CpsD/CapB family tyrosine-protein kinase [Clostridia bacterium]
ALIGMKSVEDIIRHSQYENLDYICAGDIPPNPAELLGSEKFINVIGEIEKKYDYIICDTCPVNIVTDTAIISKVIPDVVFVTLQNSTEREALKEAVKTLEFAGAKIIGFVLNGVEFDYKGEYKYRYGRRYYRAGGRYSANHSYDRGTYDKVKKKDSEN